MDKKHKTAQQFKDRINCYSITVYDKSGISSSTNKSDTVERLLWGHPFFTRKVAFQEGWPLARGRNQYIYI